MWYTRANEFIAYGVVVIAILSVIAYKMSKLEKKPYGEKKIHRFNFVGEFLGWLQG